MKELMTVGFLFSQDKEKVVLIEKRHPDWQKGKLNGVGGHVQLSDGNMRLESTVVAMSREMKEETGLVIPHELWQPFAIMEGEDWKVTVYKAILPNDIPGQLQQLTDEDPKWCEVDDIVNGRLVTIPNLRWLIPMALDESEYTYKVIGVMG